MNNRLFFAVLTLIGLLLFSCKDKKQVGHWDDSATLKEEAVLTLQLDSGTAFSMSSFGITDTKQGEVFTMLNRYDKSIKVFNIENPQNNKTIYLEEKGANGIGSFKGYLSHLYVNDDSIFIYNGSQNITLFLVNSKSKVLSATKLYSPKEKTVHPFPQPTAHAPILKVGNKLYFSCGCSLFQKKFSNYPMVLEFNIANKKLRYIFPMSKKYDKGFWGSFYRYLPAFTYNSLNHKFVLNYPVDEKLYFGNEKTGKISLIDKAVSSKLIKTPEPMDSDINYGFSKNIDYQKISRFTNSNSDYSAIYYDPYQNVYYRMVYIKHTKDELKTGKVFPNFSIIVLDSNFNRLCEQFFDIEKYDYNMVLVSKKGLLIARKDLYDKNDNELSFSVFKVKMNEKNNFQQ